VYTADPKTDKSATFLSRLTYLDVLTRELRVIDSTAISLLKDNNIPLRVIDLNRSGNLRRVVMGEDVGTLIS
jgi:uridylate kinase